MYTSWGQGGTMLNTKQATEPDSGVTKVLELSDRDLKEL